MDREDFDLLSDNNRPALMELVQNYICWDDPEKMSSGKPRMGLLQLYVSCISFR